MIINAVKVIFEIRADQEYKCQLSVLASADCETLNSTIVKSNRRSGDRVNSGKHLMLWIIKTKKYEEEDSVF